MKYERVRLGEVLERSEDVILVDPSATYRIAGVRGFNRGLFYQRTIMGADTKYRALNALSEGQVVYSKLKAFEGAIAVVPEEFSGTHVSPEFPTYKPIQSMVSPVYLSHLFAWEGFLQRLTAGSKGVGARRERVHPTDFEAIAIPLPSLDDQRQIFHRLDDLRQWQERWLSKVPEQQPVRHLPSLIQAILDGSTTDAVAVGDLVDIQSDIVHPGDDVGEAREFVGLEHVEGHTGRRIGGRPVGGETGRKQRFRPGDVIFGYLRPYLNKVWVSDQHGLCSVEQFVLRPREGVDARLLAHVLRSRGSLDSILLMTNRLQLPRVRAAQLLGLEVANCRGDHSEIVMRLDRVVERTAQLQAATVRRSRAAAALLPAARNEIFNQFR